MKWDAMAGFEHSVCDGKSVVEDDIVGEISHRETVELPDGARMDCASGVDAVDMQLSDEHNQAKSVYSVESSATVCVGPVSWPVAESRLKTVTVAER